MGARTDAARTEVVAARQALATESARMGTATREAVDIPAKIRRAPAKSAAVAGGAAFVVLGGPRRIVRRLRRAVRGEPAPMPSSMLPKEIDKAIRSSAPTAMPSAGPSSARLPAISPRTASSPTGASGARPRRPSPRPSGRPAAAIGLQLVKRALAGESSEVGSAFDQMRRIIQRGTTGTAVGYDADEAAKPPPGGPGGKSGTGTGSGPGKLGPSGS